jgi:hypothetical protein
MYEGVNSCSDPHQLDEMGRLLWKAYGHGAINDGEATYLASIIERRRPVRRMALWHTNPAARGAGRVVRPFHSTPHAKIARPQGLEGPTPHARRIERIAG